MRSSLMQNAALFMALAVTATPALAGTAHGGTSRATTDEYASLPVGTSPTADKDATTVEVPLAQAVNIQPGVRQGDTVKANSDANAKLQTSTASAKPAAQAAVADKDASEKGNHSAHTADMKSMNSMAAKTPASPDAPPLASH